MGRRGGRRGGGRDRRGREGGGGKGQEREGGGGGEKRGGRSLRVHAGIQHLITLIQHAQLSIFGDAKGRIKASQYQQPAVGIRVKFSSQTTHTVSV